MSENATKKRILEAMYDLIAENGYNKASIGQIADAIGIKKASVYYYFKSKEEIFLQLVKELYQDDYLERPILLEKGITADLFQKELVSFVDDLIDSYFENPSLRKVYAEIDLQTTRIPALKEISAKANERLMVFLNKCMEQGVAIGAFPKGFDTEVNAQILYTIFIGIDAAILYDLPIEPKIVYRAAILNLFAEKELL